MQLQNEQLKDNKCVCMRAKERDLEREELKTENKTKKQGKRRNEQKSRRFFLFSRTERNDIKKERIASLHHDVDDVISILGRGITLSQIACACPNILPTKNTIAAMHNIFVVRAISIFLAFKCSSNYWLSHTRQRFPSALKLSLARPEMMRS